MAKDPTTCRLTKRQVNYYLYRIYKLLRSGKNNLIFERMKKERGLMDPNTHDIWIDPEDRILPSLIHECLHEIYPLPKLTLKQAEKWILKLEKKISRRISDRQMKNLLLLFAETIKNSHQAPKLKKPRTIQP